MPAPLSDDLFRQHIDVIVAALAGDDSLNEMPHDRFTSDPEHVESFRPYTTSPSAETDTPRPLAEAGGLPDDLPTRAYVSPLPEALHSPLDEALDTEQSNAEDPDIGSPFAAADTAVGASVGEPSMSEATDTIARLLANDPVSVHDDTATTQPLDLPATTSGPTPTSEDPSEPTADDAHDDAHLAGFVGGIPVGELPTIGHDDETDYAPREASDDSDDSADFPVSANAHKWWQQTPRDLLSQTTRKPVLLVVVVILVVIGIVVAGAAILGGGSDGEPSIATSAPTSRPRTTTDAAGPGSGDSQIPVLPVTSRCPAGSTNAMQAFDNQAGTAWVCVRSMGLDGQVLRVHLDGTFVISSISIVPGFNSATRSGEDQWQKHRTVSRVKYAFNDPEHTTVTQSTNSVRNEVVTKLNPPVLASTVTITILETAPPTGGQPNQAVPSSTPGKQGTTDDFAVSAFTLIGHKPN